MAIFMKWKYFTLNNLNKTWARFSSRTRPSKKSTVRWRLVLFRKLLWQQEANSCCQFMNAWLLCQNIDRGQEDGRLLKGFSSFTSMRSLHRGCTLGWETPWCTYWIQPYSQVAQTHWQNRAKITFWLNFSALWNSHSHVWFLPLKPLSSLTFQFVSHHLKNYLKWKKNKLKLCLKFDFI